MTDRSGFATATMRSMLSIVLLSYQSARQLASAVEEIVRVMEQEEIPFEIIIIDDGSSDDSFNIARTISSRDNRIIAHRLSKNFGSPYSQFAGLSMARGACAISLPDDLQTPASVAAAMYRLWEKGHKIVVAYRETRRDGIVRDALSNLYYRVMNRFSDVTFPPGGSDRFLADREVIDILNNQIRPINTTPILEALRLGFDPYFLGFDRPHIPELSRWTLRRRIRLAMDTFFGSSSYPIRAITVLGLTLFISCLFLVIVIVWARLFTDYEVFGLATNGWATSMVVMTMLNGLILLSVGIVAEYIWRIHVEVKGRPGYIIRRDRGDDGHTDEGDPHDVDGQPGSPE